MGTLRKKTRVRPTSRTPILLECVQQKKMVFPLKMLHWTSTAPRFYERKWRLTLVGGLGSRQWKTVGEKASHCRQAGNFLIFMQIRFISEAVGRCGERAGKRVHETDHTPFLVFLSVSLFPRCMGGVWGEIKSVGGNTV